MLRSLIRTRRAATQALALCLLLAIHHHAPAIAPTVSTGDVTVTEFAAATSDRLVKWPVREAPTLGMGRPWFHVDFDDTLWESGPGGFGYGAGGVGTTVNTYATAWSI